MRLAEDINDHTTDPVRGDTAGELVQFVGDTMYTLIAEWVWLGVEESGGVFVDNILDADINRIYFSHNNMATATDYAAYPYTAAGSINFNTYLQTDADAHYWMYFTTTPSGWNFGTSEAILVEDNDGAAISGTVGGQSSVSFTFDYDGNDQGGRDIITPTDPDITIVAIGLDGAQYVLYEGAIARSKTNSYSLVAALERNYSNP